MIPRRTIVIASLLLFPVLVYIGFGAYALWQTGLFRWTWWIIPVTWVGVYIVSNLWRKPTRQVDPIDAPKHWTPVDEAATRIVQNQQTKVDDLEPEQLTDLQFYVKSAQELAKNLSRHYHPDSQETISSLTVVEILAAIRLAVDDIEDWFQDAVPGSHLVTIKQWKMLGKAPKWVQRASDAGWLASLVWNPLNAARYVTSKLTLAPITDELKSEILAAVYLRFIRHIGFYLIEMNSGRLRRGALRYRQTFGAKSQNGEPPAESPPPQIEPKSVTIALIGQVKAGKSSLVNALIGKRETVTDVLPATRLVSRHQLNVPDSNESVTLLDTPGYADAGATKTEARELQNAVQEADVLVLVVDAHSPARSADVEVVEQIKAFYEENRRLKPPPMVVCLSHIDLLSPMMEWNPPYDWETPNSPKEESIRDAIAANESVFGDAASAYVPVCTDNERGRTYNVETGLISTISSLVDDGKAVGLVKAYEADLDRDRWSTLLDQLKNSGTTMLNLWVDERLKSGKK